MDATLYDESTFHTIATSLLYHARSNPTFKYYLRQAFGGEDEPLPSQCESFVTVLYRANRRATREVGFEDSTISDPAESGTFYPEDLSSADEDRPESVVRPALLMRLLGAVAHNSDLPDDRTIQVEAAVARLVLDNYSLTKGLGLIRLS